MGSPVLHPQAVVVISDHSLVRKGRQAPWHRVRNLVSNWDVQPPSIGYYVAVRQGPAPSIEDRTAFVQLLRAIATGSHRSGPPQEALDRFDVHGLTDEAENSVSVLLLHEYMRERGLRPNAVGKRAARLRTRRFVLVTLVVEYRSEATRGYLVYAECGSRRPSVAFIGDDLAFVRGGRVVVLPLVAVRDEILRFSSLEFQAVSDGLG